MGAIYGIFGEGEPGDMERMGVRLAHRGAGTRRWAPAHDVRFGCRLTDHEPFEQVAGERIALDGGVDNRDEIARLLGDPHGAGRGDAALLVDLFHVFGPSGLAHVDGQFGLAIWDAGAARLVLARDPWSIRPLYLARVGRRWLFASEQKALLAVADVPRRPTATPSSTCNAPGTCPATPPALRASAQFPAALGCSSAATVAAGRSITAASRSRSRTAPPGNMPKSCAGGCSPRRGARRGGTTGSAWR